MRLGHRSVARRTNVSTDAQRMTSTQKKLEQAVKFHQAGNLQEAEFSYRQILQAHPQDVNALHLLGVLCHQSGRNDLAIDYIGKAIRLCASFPEAHCNMGSILRAEGRLDEAVASLKKCLHMQPHYFDAHNILGTAYLQQRKLEDAARSYREAVRLRPGFAEAHNNLGIVLKEQGKLDEASACCREALRHQPSFAEAHTNLGNILKDQGKLDEASVCYRTALRHKPDYGEAHINMGNVLKDQGKPEEALTCYREGLLFTPNSAEAHCNLGLVLRDLGNLAEATAAFEQAIRLKPSFAGACIHLGRVLREQGKLAEAINAFEQALRLKPDLADVHGTMGSVFHQQGKLDDAVAAYEQAIRLRPNLADSYNNLGNCLHDQFKYDEAITTYEHALKLQPDHADAHFNLGMTLLAQGAFEKGWTEYEWRRQIKKYRGSMRQFAQPLWDGRDLEGKTILLHAEQGIGDVVQFVRYAPLLKKRGGIVVFECPVHLTRLLAGLAGVDQIIPAGTPLPDFDVHLPLLSAPALFGTTLSTIPAEIPYLTAEPDLVERWAHELEKSDGGLPRRLRIGITWQGNPKHGGDRQRSFPLACFEPLGRIDGVRLFSLQKGPGSEQLAQLAGRFSVIDLGPRLDSFADTAAVMKNLDLIVTADTSPAHVAGALGVPVWVGLPLVPDWRWLLSREDSPWYPTMRLFRQTQAGDWHGVFERMVGVCTRLFFLHPLGEAEPVAHHLGLAITPAHE